MSKNKKQAIAILAAVFVVFTICVFVIPFSKGAIFWIAYFAEVIAIAAQIPVFKLAFDNRDDLKSKVLGFPVFRVGYIYLGVQTAASLVLFVFDAAVEGFPVWVSVIVCVIIIAGAFICSMAADIARDRTENIAAVQAVNTEFIKTIRIKSQQLVNRTDDAELKKELEALAESFKYSDPVSSEKTADLENTLDMTFSLLESAVSEGNVSESVKLCGKAHKILDDRNIACKMNK